MSDEVGTGLTTLVVLLGASEWPLAPELGSFPSFANSARAIEDYFLGDVFALPQENMLNLFDIDASPAGIDNELSVFLRTRIAESKRRQRPIRDVIIYYVGHGGFTRGDQEYFLAIRKTRSNSPASSIRMKDLAGRLREDASTLRRHVILDACFSAAAYSDFMGAIGQASLRKAHQELAHRGTSLLCSSSAWDPSRAPSEEYFTMFSGGLLHALKTGSNAGEPYLSIYDLYLLITEYLRDRHPDDAVRPEVHEPDQRDGSVAAIRWFPNPSLRPGAEPEPASEHFADSTDVSRPTDDDTPGVEPAARQADGRRRSDPSVRSASLAPRDRSTAAGTEAELARRWTRALVRLSLSVATIGILAGVAWHLRRNPAGAPRAPTTFDSGSDPAAGTPACSSMESRASEPAEAIDAASRADDAPAAPRLEKVVRRRSGATPGKQALVLDSTKQPTKRRPPSETTPSASPAKPPARPPEQSEPVHVTIHAIVATGEFRLDDALGAAEARHEDIVRCALSYGVGEILPKSVRVEVMLGPGGHGAGAKPMQSDFMSREVGSCVADALRGLQFAIDADWAVVDYVIDFAM